MLNTLLQYNLLILSIRLLPAVLHKPQLLRKNTECIAQTTVTQKEYRMYDMTTPNSPNKGEGYRRKPNRQSDINEKDV